MAGVCSSAAQWPVLWSTLLTCSPVENHRWLPCVGQGYFTPTLRFSHPAAVFLGTGGV